VAGCSCGALRCRVRARSARTPQRKAPKRTYTVLNFVHYFRLDSVLQTEGRHYSTSLIITVGPLPVTLAAADE